MLRRKDSSTVGDVPTQSCVLYPGLLQLPAFGWDCECGETPVCMGGGPWGRGTGSVFRSPGLTSQERSRSGAYGPLGMVWLDDIPIAPRPLSPCLLPPPSLHSSHHPTLQPQCGQQVASRSPRWAVTLRRTTLTSQGVLGHTEAQGLQPVVDVRFGHGKLEFCRAQRVMLVTEILRTKRKFAQCHLG